MIAALLYALSIPFSKLLLNELSAYTISGLLYLGAGIGMLAIRPFIKNNSYAKFTKKEMPYIALMIVLDIAAPILLLIGLKTSSSENVSLLNNFEIVATSLLALLFFKEVISKRLWLGITLITASSIILSINSVSAFSFSYGSLFVLGACVCWGLENNCTRVLSKNDPYKVVIIKGFGAGATAIIISLLIGEFYGDVIPILLTLLLGALAYGLSIFFYIKAQKKLGAARTSAYYALAPFIGVVLALIMFMELPAWTFYVALALMAVGVLFVIMASRERDVAKALRTK